MTFIDLSSLPPLILRTDKSQHHFGFDRQTSLNWSFLKKKKRGEWHYLENRFNKAVKRQKESGGGGVPLTQESLVCVGVIISLHAHYTIVNM